METTYKTQNIKKRSYSKPLIEHIKLDNDISIFMTSDTPPEESINPTDHFSINPFKLPKL
jgi:hypothetical protein